jgi:hypothetical protein
VVATVATGRKWRRRPGEGRNKPNRCGRLRQLRIGAHGRRGQLFESVGGFAELPADRSRVRSSDSSSSEEETALLFASSRGSPTLFDQRRPQGRSATAASAGSGEQGGLAVNRACEPACRRLLGGGRPGLDVRVGWSYVCRLVSSTALPGDGGPLVGGGTVGGFLAAWLAHVRGRVRRVTFEGYEVLVRRHALPAWGALELAALRPLHLQDLYGRLLAGGARSRSELAYLSRLSDSMRFFSLNPPTECQSTLPGRRDSMDSGY